MPRRVVHNIHLAGVEAGFELREWDIQLKRCCFSIFGSGLRDLDERTLICLHFALKKGDIAQ